MYVWSLGVLLLKYVKNCKINLCCHNQRKNTKKGKQTNTLALYSSIPAEHLPWSNLRCLLTSVWWSAQAWDEPTYLNGPESF